LLAANGGAKKTHIMYRCNLSFKQLHAYLKFLVEIGLLKSISEKTGIDEKLVLYETTKKGRMFVRTYEDLRVLLTTNSE
jgi:predicted transcriptional regulator